MKVKFNTFKFGQYKFNDEQSIPRLSFKTALDNPPLTWENDLVTSIASSFLIFKVSLFKNSFLQQYVNEELKVYITTDIGYTKTLTFTYDPFLHPDEIIENNEIVDIFNIESSFNLTITLKGDKGLGEEIIEEITKEIVYDIIPPVVSISSLSSNPVSEEGYTNTSLIHLYLHIDSATHYRFSQDDINWGNWIAIGSGTVDNELNGIVNYTLINPIQSINRIYIQAKDKAGNISDSLFTSIIYDTVNPINNKIQFNTFSTYSPVLNFLVDDVNCNINDKTSIIISGEIDEVDNDPSKVNTLIQWKGDHKVKLSNKILTASIEPLKLKNIKEIISITESNVEEKEIIELGVFYKIGSTETFVDLCKINHEENLLTRPDWNILSNLVVRYNNDLKPGIIKGKSIDLIYINSNDEEVSVSIKLATIQLTNENKHLYFYIADDGSSYFAHHSHLQYNDLGPNLDIPYLTVTEALEPTYKHLSRSLNQSTEWTLYSKFIDPAGNESSVEEIKVYFDDDEPNIEFTSPSNNIVLNNKNIPISYYITDPTLSDIDKVFIKVNGNPNTSENWIDITNKYNKNSRTGSYIIYNISSGTNNIYLKCSNKRSIQSPVVNLIINIDFESPTILINPININYPNYNNIPNKSIMLFIENNNVKLKWSNIEEFKGVINLDVLGSDSSGLDHNSWFKKHDKISNNKTYPGIYTKLLNMQDGWNSINQDIYPGENKVFIKCSDSVGNPSENSITINYQPLTWKITRMNLFDDNNVEFVVITTQDVWHDNKNFIWMDETVVKNRLYSYKVELVDYDYETDWTYIFVPETEVSLIKYNPVNKPGRPKVGVVIK